MKIRSAFEPREECNGQVFSMPSMTVPDMCYSIKQLAYDYSIGQLPPLRQFLYDDLTDAEEDKLTSMMAEDNFSDVRFYDKVDAMTEIGKSNKQIQAIRERVKATREFKQRQIEPTAQNKGDNSLRSVAE